MIKTYYTKQQHLQIICNPTEYPQLYEEARKSLDYYAIAPRYLISRCPFCGVLYTSLVDTHSLNSWHQFPSFYSGKAFGKADEGFCGHFNRVQQFYNLEGTVPVEKVELGARWHIPFVAPFYLPEDIPSAAVIHSFPICRIEDNEGRIYNFDSNQFVEPLRTFLRWGGKEASYDSRAFSEISVEDKKRLKTARFVPRYTGFAVTYYALDPEIIVKRYTASQDVDDWPNILPSMGEISRKYPDGYTLTKWVEKGKLYWLDLDLPDLPLRQAPIGKFPYDVDYFNAIGSRMGFIYDMGRVKLGNY